MNMRAFCIGAALLSLALLTAHAQQKPAERYTERVDVERVLVDVRVLDEEGLRRASASAPMTSA